MKRLLLLAFLIPGFAVAGPDPRGILELEGYANADATGITSKRGRNDFTIKEALASSDSLFFIKSFGYNGSAFTSTSRAQISFIANQAWTTTANGTYISLLVTPNNSTTQAEAVRVGHNGATYLKITPDLDIAVTTPTAIGQIGISAAGLVYVATATATLASWQKIGAQ